MCNKDTCVWVDPQHHHNTSARLLHVYTHTHIHTHSHARLSWRTLTPRHPNTAPASHQSLCWLFSGQSRKSRCSKFFITVSSKLQTATGHAPPTSLLDPRAASLVAFILYFVEPRKTHGRCGRVRREVTPVGDQRPSLRVAVTIPDLYFLISIGRKAFSFLVFLLRQKVLRRRFRMKSHITFDLSD